MMQQPAFDRVMAYITNGHRLLVFRQPEFPEAGIQVPGGKVELGEPLEAAILREAFEETGLRCLNLMSYLGTTRYDRVSHGGIGVQQRHYYHLVADGTVEETWEHWERHPSEGAVPEILFTFSWASIPDGVPPMVANMDEMVPILLERLGLG